MCPSLAVRGVDLDLIHDLNAASFRRGRTRGAPGSVWSVPSVDYDRHGRTYSEHRRTDPRIASRIHAALGDARTVLNVGAGTGSYEPDDRWVLAVEPSATMRAQRASGAAPAVIGRAERLPLDDDAVDAAMACFTIHHWPSARAGLDELQRVARRRVVVASFELDSMPAWQRDYLREALAVERDAFPSIADIAAELSGRVRASSRSRPPVTASMGSSRPSSAGPRRCSTPT